MNFQYIIISITVISFFLAFLWMVSIIRRGGRTFYIVLETLTGIRSRRIDFKLIEDLIIESLTFAGYIFLAANFVAFILTEEWCFGLWVAKGTLLTILAFTLISVLNRLYSSAKDKSEKPVHIREVKEKG